VGPNIVIVSTAVTRRKEENWNGNGIIDGCMLNIDAVRATGMKIYQGSD
jgi:hypothetical protein